MYSISTTNSDHISMQHIQNQGHYHSFVLPRTFKATLVTLMVLAGCSSGEVTVAEMCLVQVESEQPNLTS